MTILKVPDDYLTISDAVAAASAGDTVFIGPEHGGNESVVVATDNLTFQGPAPLAGIVLEAASGVRVISLRGDAAIHISGMEDSQTFTGNEGGNYLDGHRGSDTLSGGAGDDSLVVYDDGRDVLSGGAGDDVIRTELWMGEGKGTIDGGSGVDTVKSYGLGKFVLRGVEVLDTFTIDCTIAQLESFDRLIDSSASRTQIDVSLSGRGGTVDAARWLEGRDSIELDGILLTGGLRATATAFADDVSGSRHDDVLIGLAGNDSFDVTRGHDILNGGGGNDTFAFSRFYRADTGTIIGGAGVDTVTGEDLGNYTLRGVERIDSYFVGLTLAQLRSVDALIDTNEGNDYFHVEIDGRGGTIDFTKFVAAKAVVHVYGDTLDSAITVTTGTKDDVIYGSHFGDTIRAAGGDDALRGNGGHDLLIGGSGNDFLVGEAGNDTYLLDAALVAGNVDTFGQFETSDTIALAQKVFGAVVKGRLSQSAFKDVSSGLLDRDDRILYNSANGDLFYDADGSGAARAIKFAHVDNHDDVPLTYADFVIV